METEDFEEEDQNSVGLNNEWKINKVPIKSELDEENPNGNFNFDGEDNINFDLGNIQSL